MENRIMVIGELTIKNGKAKELRDHIHPIIEAVKLNEPDLHVYEWYMNRSETKCYIVQRFENSEAFLNHLSLMGPLLPALFALAPFTAWKIYGNLSSAAEEIIQPLAAANNIVPEIHEYIGGIVQEAV